MSLGCDLDHQAAEPVGRLLWLAQVPLSPRQEGRVARVRDHFRGGVIPGVRQEIGKGQGRPHSVPEFRNHYATTAGGDRWKAYLLVARGAAGVTLLEKPCPSNPRWDQLDEIFPTPVAVRDTMKDWLENLEDWNGRQWYAKPISLLASSDASDFGFWGLVELPNEKKVKVAGNLTEEEVGMSSTAREVIRFLRFLEATVQLCPNEIRNSTVQLTGDNQAAVLAVNQFRSRASDVNDALKRIFNLCISSDFNVSAVWKPRELLEEEDTLSRQPDASDWGMRQHVVEDICSDFGIWTSLGPTRGTSARGSSV
jgi:hypothetical protein